MMTMTQIDGIIRAEKQSASLSLANRGLTSLEDLVPLLSAMPNLRTLDLNHNSIKRLPKDLSSLVHVDALDLSSNPILGLRYIIDGLRSLPALARLTVDLAFPGESEELVMALPNLLYLNGVSLEVESVKNKGTDQPKRQEAVREAETGVDASYWTAEDSVQLEGLFADVSDQDAMSTQDFFEYMSRVVQHVTCLTAAEEDAYQQEGEVLKARRLLYEFCFGEVVRSAFKNGDQATGRRLQALLEYGTSMMDQYDSHWRRIVHDRDARMRGMQSDLEEAVRDIELLMGQVQRQGALAGDEAREERRAAAPRKGSRAMASANTTMETPPRAAGGAKPSASPQPVAPPTASVGRPAGRDSSGGTAAKSPGAAHAKHMGKRTLSLKQLKEIMEEIYSSKARYDEKCKQTQLPRETMEQHMYTYLNQKYGLKEIILEWATAIVQAVRRFAAEDNDVAVFGRILRNEVDEEFRFVQQHVRETVKELLRTFIKSEGPLRGRSEVQRILAEKMAGRLDEREWVHIVKYMYNAGDSALITSLIQKFLFRQAMPHLQRHQPEDLKLSPTSVYSQLMYRDLVRILLDFQLDGHERFLSRFVGIFRRHDADHNGIINGYEFAAIVRELDPNKTVDEIAAMLREVDILGSQLITFSESVTFLNDELLKLSYTQFEDDVEEA